MAVTPTSPGSRSLVQLLGVRGNVVAHDLAPYEWETNESRLTVFGWVFQLLGVGDNAVAQNFAPYEWATNESRFTCHFYWGGVVGHVNDTAHASPLCSRRLILGARLCTV